METCVLIPSEFSLMLRPRETFLQLLAGLKNIKSRQNATEKRTENEASVCVYSNQMVPKGACFLPFQGTIRLDRLEVYSLLNDDDVSSFLLSKLLQNNYLLIRKRFHFSFIFFMYGEASRFIRMNFPSSSSSFTLD